MKKLSEKEAKKILKQMLEDNGIHTEEEADIFFKGYKAGIATGINAVGNFLNYCMDSLEDEADGLEAMYEQ